MNEVPTRRGDRFAFLLRWIGANAIGEVFGLGGTLAVAGFVIGRLEHENRIILVLISFLIAVASSVVEATVVGLAQWWAMYPWLRSITLRAWWLATLAGALVAYVLGYLPSTIMDLGEGTSEANVSEPPQWTVLLLAVGLGIVAGAVLSFAQWLVLRKHLERAGWWLPANMLAWGAGMPLIFWGIDLAYKGQPFLQTGLIVIAALLMAGAVVGAIHGAILVWMVSRPVSSVPETRSELYES